MRIDSHHHFWNYSPEQYGWISRDMEVLRRGFTPADLQSEIQTTEVEGVVSVQARQSLEETQWLLELASQHVFIRGVVGWLPLTAPNVRDDIERLSQHSLFRGVRHVVQDEPDDAFILGEDFNRGVGMLNEFDLVYDILIYAKHLPNTVQFVDRHPEQTFVLDHIAKPTISRDQFDVRWAANIKELAKRAQVTCKFSALVTEVRDPQWSVELLRPYWNTVLEAFGTSRLMFGSDWPVCLLRSDYARWVATVEQLAADLSPTEQEDLWAQTAIRTYRL